MRSLILAKARCAAPLLLTLAHAIDASAQFGSQFVSQSVPTSMIAGQSYPVVVTMKNTGSNTWTNVTGSGTPNAFSLGSQNPQDNVVWGLSPYANRVPVTGRIDPGATATFAFTVKAPASPGTYDFQWQMVDDFVAWFGTRTPNVRVAVSAPGALLDARFVSQNVPTTMVAGKSYPVSITLKNTGTTSWSNTTGPGTPSAFSLGAQNPQDNLNWGLAPFPNRVPVASSVAPGATATFFFNVVAPAAAGTYGFQWQMVEDYVAWFGATTPNLGIEVSAAPLLDAQFIGLTVPSSMTAGERYPVSVTFKNTGSGTWNNTTGPGTPNAFSLGSQNPQDNALWGLSPFPNRVPVTGSVPPGATATFVFDVVAPATPGTYSFQWQMVDEYVAWFGPATPNERVLVGSPLSFVAGPINFDAGPFAFAQAVFADFDGNGWYEPFGTVNDGSGRLTVLSIGSMGLNELLSAVRPNDLRAADLDGDGCPDIVAQGYSAYSPSPNIDSRAMLYFNNGAGTFTADASFSNLNLNGRGEGLVVADFNNDGATDLYLPYYTFGASFPCIPADECPNSPQSYLLLNDRTGHFMEGDVPGSVDLALPPGGQPEGVQALDVNDDGRIDLYVAGHLFLNQGTDAGGRVRFADCNCGLPASVSGLFAEEGAKFLDWNNDGLLDVILHDPYGGPQLYENVGTRSAPLFQLRTIRPDGFGWMFGAKLSGPSGTTYSALGYCASYGMNVYDLDNDGLEDVVVVASPYPPSTGCDFPSYVLRNTGGGFESVRAGALSGFSAGGVFGFGDVDRDGKIDAMYLGPFPFYFTNATDTGARGSFTIDVRGANGEQNQFGRIVRASLPDPQCAVRPGSGCTLTRAVDGGSGYHAQSQYPILFGTPYAGAHAIEVVFPDPANPSGTVTVRATASPGQYVQVFAPSLANPTGRVSYGRPLPAQRCRTH
ncbi:MAG TPA: FG-GAP-like repeat-containing protein [Vicinamibacterales bacterium]|nr:FG-GAP-like repeat-containing protein [Vicinamibacterales bacterium]